MLVGNCSFESGNDLQNRKERSETPNLAVYIRHVSSQIDKPFGRWSDLENSLYLMSESANLSIFLYVLLSNDKDYLLSIETRLTRLTVGPVCVTMVLPKAKLTSGPPYTRLRGPKAGPQLSLSRGPWAPNGHCFGAQRAPNEKCQGALGPPIKIISGNPDYACPRSVVL
jgi:hypothetical protein